MSIPIRRYLLLISTGLVALGVRPAGAQQTAEGPKFTTNAAEISIGGRVQTQFNTTSVNEEPSSLIFLRRVRLEATVRVNDLVSGKVQPDFAGNRVSLKDAYLKLNFSPGLQILAGNAHRPFSLLEQTSSSRMLPIERGADIRGIDAFDEYKLVNNLKYSDRDVGLQIMGTPRGAPLGFTYAAGLFQGPLGAGVGGEATRQFAARATVKPLDELRLGVGWSSRDFSRKVTDDVFEMERGSAFEVDFEYGAFDPGLHVLGEVALGDFNPFAGEDFLGAQIWAGYRTQPVGIIATIEPIFRASYGKVDRGLAVGDDLGGMLVTPGINLYLGGLNRLMLNYDVWMPDGEREAESSFKAMFQMVF